MRRGRRHRHGHRLIDRKQHPGGSGEALREAKSGNRARGQIRWSSDFRCQVHGAPSLDPEGRDRSPRHAVPRRRRRGPGTTSPWSRRSAIAGLEPDEVSNEMTGIIMGSGRPFDPRHRRGPPISPAARDPSAFGPLRGAQGHELDHVGDARHLVSRSRASTIRSRRPARPRTTASAMPWR